MEQLIKNLNNIEDKNYELDFSNKVMTLECLEEMADKV
jgi:hypothetical protein